MGFLTCLDKLIASDDDKIKANIQADAYRNKGGIFSSFMAKNTVYKRSPVDWWTVFGSETPELKDFAVRILSLTCSSSACERNWSAFNMIHTKKRNRLQTRKLNDLVYVMYNKRLQYRHLKKLNLQDDEDPLVISDDVPSDDEWMIAKKSTDLSEPNGRKRLRSIDKGKAIHQGMEEPEFEDGSTEEEDDRMIRYHDDSLDDDTTDDDGGDYTFDPNFRPIMIVYSILVLIKMTYG